MAIFGVLLLLNILTGPWGEQPSAAGTGGSVQQEAEAMRSETASGRRSTKPAYQRCRLDAIEDGFPVFMACGLEPTYPPELRVAPG